MIGKVLGNRYEIIEKIGTGGMSIVYKAKCRLLNRFVAVKILRDEFADNAEFIKRFKIEAQAAASLSHPNIVSIYDVGNQDNLNYIVMEYVDGVTLKEYITEKKLLNWKESINIAVQICSALEHAHKNGIIHRDIKPHNIIITKEMTAKVMDFGIARAASFFTVTFAGNAIGSVHYFSPEQARGGYTDNKSDIYSLGVVLYEMLTGVVPFEGDSPVAIAFKHVQQNPITPKEINSSIPLAVNNIVIKAMSKEIDKRYQVATDMLNDLNSALLNPDDKMLGAVSRGNEVVDSPTLILPPVNVPINTDNNVNSEETMTKTKRPRTRKEKITLYAAIATSLVIVALVGLLGWKLLSTYSKTAAEVVLPNLVGKTEEEARNILSSMGGSITLVVKDRRSDETVTPGTVIEQSPVAGMNVKIPNDVNVVISTGKKEVTIPDVENKDYREAQFALEKLGLMPKLMYEASETIPIGFVTRLNPPVSSKANQGTTVEVYASNGPGTNAFKMPNLVGKTLDEAKKTLTDNKLQIGSTSYSDSSSAYGTVIAQSVPSGNSVGEGTAINLTLSTGKKPSVTGGTSKLIDIALPQGKSQVYVEVRLTDSKGVQTVAYPKTLHNTSEGTISVTVYGTGKCRMQVYFDGKPGAEESINFGEAR